MPDDDRSADRADAPGPPVARVAVDVSLPHLDRTFDYLVPAGMAAAAQPGVRVRVRFSGRLVDGFVLAPADAAEPERRLAELTAVVSPEPVLTDEVAGLARAVADRYAGTLADVLRLAVPRRHAGVEAESRADDGLLVPAVPAASVLSGVSAALVADSSQDADPSAGPARAVPALEPALASEPVSKPVTLSRASEPGSVSMTPDPASIRGATPTDRASAIGPAGWDRYVEGRSWLDSLRALPPPAAAARWPSGRVAADPQGRVAAEWEGRVAADRQGRAKTETHRPAGQMVGPSQPGERSPEDGRDPPRAVWTALPGEDWPARLAEAVAAACRSGRGALVVVPDRRDLARADAALTAALGPDRHVALSAELGPRERYRRFLRLSRGQVRVAVGTRAAMFAPVADLGLVVVWDDGDDLHAEPRAPYPHVRDVLLLRARRTGSAALLGGFAVTAESALLLRSGWARPVAADRRSVRSAAPLVAAISDADLPRDPLARAARLPHAAFEAARRSLAAGRPVLVQAPRSGYAPALACALCRRPARCSHCGGPLQRSVVRPVGERTAPDPVGPSTPGPVTCGWCGRPAADWTCPVDGHHRLRAAVVGADRTAEELGRAFPGIRVRTSRGGAGSRVLTSVPDAAALVVATPGAEPPVAGAAGAGYGAVLLLDGWLPLSRPDLRATEEAVRRWLGAAALAVPAAAGGQVVLVADAGLTAVQAVVRWDPAGLARRELDDRVALHFPPAARTVSLSGPPEAVAELVRLVELPADAEVLGPVPAPRTRNLAPARRLTAPAAPEEPEPVQMLLRAPLACSSELVAAVKAASGVRSARKSPGAVRVQVDPTELG